MLTMSASADAAAFLGAVAYGSSGPFVPQAETAVARPRVRTIIFNDRVDADTGITPVLIECIIAINRDEAKPALFLFPIEFRLPFSGFPKDIRGRGAAMARPAFDRFFDAEHVKDFRCNFRLDGLHVLER